MTTWSTIDRPFINIWLSFCWCWCLGLQCALDFSTLDCGPLRDRVLDACMFREECTSSITKSERSRVGIPSMRKPACVRLKSVSYIQLVETNVRLPKIHKIFSLRSILSLQGRQQSLKKVLRWWPPFINFPVTVSFSFWCWCWCCAFHCVLDFPST